jgi:hypothetical protein
MRVGVHKRTGTQSIHCATQWIERGGTGWGGRGEGGGGALDMHLETGGGAGGGGWDAIGDKPLSSMYDKTDFTPCMGESICISTSLNIRHLGGGGGGVGNVKTTQPFFYKKKKIKKV